MHVDRHLIGGDVSADISLDFCVGRGWCLEEAVEETHERIHAHILNKLLEAKLKVDTMVHALEVKEPVVTKRDTNEFG